MGRLEKSSGHGFPGAATKAVHEERRSAGVWRTGVGTGDAGAEYPEKFEKIRQALPDYLTKACE